MTKPWKRRLVVIAVVAVLVTIASISFFIDRCSNPPDRIKVSAVGLPKETNFACFISLNKGNLQTMHWSCPSIIGPRVMHPNDCIWSDPHSLVDGTIGVDWNAYVQWREGERYGIVTRSDDLKWHVTWFDADKVDIRNRRTFFGGGEVAFDVSKGQTEALSEKNLKALGLADVRPPLHLRP